MTAMCQACGEEMSDRPEEQHGFQDYYYDADGGLHQLVITHPHGLAWVTSMTKDELVRMRAWFKAWKDGGAHD